MYMADIEIVENLDKYLDDFYYWKLSSEFDVKDFVIYLWKEKGADTITFVKNVGVYPNLTDEYKKIRWHNF